MTRTAQGAAKAPRPPARERILSTATTLFSEYGIRGVGIDRIIAESGVAKATLYTHFKSKDALALAFLAGVDVAWRGMLTDAAAAAGDDPADQLVGLFDAIDAASENGRFRGCPFLNTASESAPGSPAHRATVEHKRAVRAWTGGLAEAAGAREPALLARQLTVLLDGAMAAAALEPTDDVLPAVRQAARHLVEAARPSSASGD
ncbi:TetR/AcrR family transcriptional regulator [Streptomyces aureoverticillatus]|uniref:TetR/AcrR family transcriptional regulator n=1 Tax=Streptomyces aureoverticillatus TaxID=66871 RepID=UPI0013D9F7FB|nr:TetR/AcrR family transcriptional regulator [Streptomyces aureoverticillatus]QIB44242.1 TetR/AcrR family transcriptional regulator [Streptomyces aureoverticillatus]